jgi:hypothetical protein
LNRVLTAKYKWCEKGQPYRRAGEASVLQPRQNKLREAAKQETFADGVHVLFNEFGDKAMGTLPIIMDRYMS